MSSDVQFYKRLKEAELTSSTDGNLANTAGSIIAQVQTRGLQVPMTVQANANANVAETIIEVVTFAGKFKSGNITVPSNVAANVASYSIVTVNKRTAGGAAVVVATANLSNVAATAWTPLALTVANAANAQVAAGDVLTYQINASAAPGVALPTGTLLDVEYEDV